jgi:uncharacterized membrane protein YeiB
MLAEEAWPRCSSQQATRGRCRRRPGLGAARHDGDARLRQGRERRPTAATFIAAGRSAATFALVAGVSVAFLSGGRRILHGRARTAVAASLAVRAVLIGAIGLLLGFAKTDTGVILAFYGGFFLLTAPLLGVRTRALAPLSAVFLVLGPVLLVALARMGVPFPVESDDPTFVTLLTHPLRLLVQLLVTGEYPAVIYLAYLCAGLAVGRLDLTSGRVAGWLLGGGIALAVTARTVSLALLYPLGGLDRLVAQGGFYAEDASPAVTLLWDPEQGSSWWYLALASPHAHTPFDLAHTLGSALAVLGAALLLTRIPAVGRLLGPIRAAGAMTLTLYSAHILVLETGLLEDHLTALYLFLVLASLIFAVVWRRWRDRGPLEQVVAVAADHARRAVLESSGGGDDRPVLAGS